MHCYLSYLEWSWEFDHLWKNIIVPSIVRGRCSCYVKLQSATAEPSIGSPVIGVIDGKIEFVYLCTITIGSEELRGVLYQSIRDSEYQTPPSQCQNMNIKDTVSTFTEKRVQQKTLPIEEEEQVAPIQENGQLCSERMVEKESASPQKKASESHGEIPRGESKMPKEERDWMGIEDRTETATESINIQEKELVVNEVREEKQFVPIQGKQLLCNEKNENNHMANEEKHSAEVRENVENEAVHAKEKRINCSWRGFYNTTGAHSKDGFRES